ncbi:MAG: methyltransferase [Treponema sp.]|nr:methyltransferase [Treponema sp.]
MTLPIARLAGGGAGIGRREGKTVFMDMTAPGDVATGTIIEERRNWARAELLDIVEASPDRVAPRCPLYGSCGGCSLQHLDYAAQLREKAAILTGALNRIGGWQAPPDPKVHPSPPYEYRNRMQLHCIPQLHNIPQLHPIPQSSNDGQPAVGLMGRRSGDVVPVKDCPVADPLIRRALRQGSIEAPPGKERFTIYGRGETFLREGDGWGTVTIRGRALYMDAEVFFQSNGRLLELLIGDILTAAERADRSLPAADLYAGVGTFAAFLEGRFPRIDLVESNRAALDLARKNAPGRANRFFAQLDDVVAEYSFAEYGFAVLDPPRTGLSTAARRRLCEAGPALLAYVSCDPATLARDSGDIREKYRFCSLDFYDFYPQTAHIESLAVFERINR